METDGSSNLVHSRSYGVEMTATGAFLKKKRKDQPVELLQVSWLEVTGSLGVDQLPKGQELMFKFNVRLKSDAFGWKNAPVYLSAGFGRACSWKKYDLSLLKKETIVEVPQYPRVKVPTNPAPGDKIHFGMYEIWTGTWKGGLFIHDVVIEAV
ncbi:uncharacterized protein A4U43_C06F1050 [Asparagus officinalis]|uniref:Protein PHLOEM PROTEIN 2-LIKE A9-like n=1 Tax=Asparagus officinalis TaxID=4686 RepID=A0A5P1EIL4_ASPOF|nr:uncharacterized protein A4U43_C06F1050 [Asparagus officinalis]